MKHISVLLFVLLFAASGTQAQEGMEEYMELMKPGPEHEWLEQLVGTWNMRVSMWESPGEDPVLSDGISEHRMILGDRFLEMEAEAGKDALYTKTLTIMGFDRRYEEFTFVGFDTWGTYYITAKGSYDKEARKWTLYGEDTDPVMDYMQKYHYHLTMLDDDTMKLEIIFIDFPLVEEKEYKMLEIMYTRR